MTHRRNKILSVVLVLLVTAFAGWKLFPSTVHPVPGSSMRQKQNEYLTPFATPTDLPPTPTETLIPFPELPTPESSTPAIETWAAPPTYAESQPGYYFHVDFDNSIWSLTEDETGELALIHRGIPYCKILPTAGRGQPRNWTVDDQFRDIGPLRYEVVSASQDGIIRFVNYFGGDGIVTTGFRVSFQDRMDECLQASEIVLSSLTSMAAPTPTLTATETPTPNSTPLQ